MVQVGINYDKELANHNRLSLNLNKTPLIIISLSRASSKDLKIIE